MASQSLLLFFKLPEVGSVKTRLGRQLGMQQACDVHEAMLNWRLHSLTGLQGKYDVWYYVAPPKNEDVARRFESTWQLGKQLKRQEGTTLGERMLSAFQAHIKQFGDKVVLVGSDIPFLSHELIKQAFEQLKQNDIVLGPCEDGGYYLIGGKKAHRELFDDIPWGTNQVLQRTKEKCRQLNLKTTDLKQLFDVDDEDSLRRFHSLI